LEFTLQVFSQRSESHHARCAAAMRSSNSDTTSEAAGWSDWPATGSERSDWLDV